MNTKLILLSLFFALSSGYAEEISQRKFSLSGTYQYLGDSLSSEREAGVIYFPTENRNHTDAGYGSEQPPENWYAKIPQNTLIIIEDLVDSLKIEHTSLFGAYNPAQLGGRIVSTVDLRSMHAKEVVSVDNQAKTIHFYFKRGNRLQGSVTDTLVVKMPNGDIKVTDKRIGCDWFPFPGCVQVNDVYIMRKL